MPSDLGEGKVCSLGHWAVVVVLGLGREAFLERGSQEMARNLRAGRPRPQCLSSHPRALAPFLPVFFLALPAPAMRPQATHSRWLQRGHLQWVLKSPWWQRLQQPGMPGLSSVLAGPWPAEHGRE